MINKFKSVWWKQETHKNFKDSINDIVVYCPPEPTDVNWDNLISEPYLKFKRRTAIEILLFLILAGTCYLIFIINKY